VSIALRPDEQLRLAALARYEVLDTPRESDFDDIVQLAAEICGTPIAVVNLIGEGRQFFKAEVGLGVRETPLDTSFCGHAIMTDDFMMVPDATLDARFASNPLITGAPGLRFYAGALLKTPEGLPIGTLCVLDYRPAVLSEQQQSALRILARQVMTQLELRRALAQQRSADERHRRILESAIDYGIISMDLNGIVTSWNEGAHRILGWTEVEMCGRPCDDFFTPKDRIAKVPEIEMDNALSHGRGSDERWHLRQDGTTFWASGEMMPLVDDEDKPVGFLKILRDRTEARLASEALKAAEVAAERDRDLLTGELAHRVKNTLAIVQAIVGQSLSNAATIVDGRTKIEERLVSLGRAHDILTSKNWASAPIAAVIEAATSIHGHQEQHIRLHGPDVMIQARAAVGLSMAIHELCTNAVKYGALSVDAGRVEIDWTILGQGDNAELEITWQEVGGPAVTPPTKRGFGSRLIRASLSGGAEGTSEIDYRAEGVRWKATSRLSAIEEN
jgi:PAS domain S-box-containing protein